MDLRLITIFVICAYDLIPCGAKPTTLTQLKNGDLTEEFVEFLHHDKQFNELIAEVENSPDALPRERRQTKNTVETMDVPRNYNQDESQDGFFDRAAKFIMELVQRFIKWMSSD